MAELTWGDPLDRVVEAGLDRGVLYTGETAVPWNGLVRINQMRAQSRSRSYYQDGVKTGEYVYPSAYQARLDAFTYPDEFIPFDGYSENARGFYVDEQHRKSFGLSYRTFVDNNPFKASPHYRIHLVYNVMASPMDVTYNTLGESSSPTLMSWNLSAVPLPLRAHRAASHFVIDSRKAANAGLREVERIIWGTNFRNPRMLTANELDNFFYAYSDTGYGFGSYGHTNYGIGERE